MCLRFVPGFLLARIGFMAMPVMAQSGAVTLANPRTTETIYIENERQSICRRPRVFFEPIGPGSAAGPRWVAFGLTGHIGLYGIAPALVENAA